MAGKMSKAAQKYKAQTIEQQGEIVQLRDQVRALENANEKMAQVVGQRTEVGEIALDTRKLPTAMHVEITVQSGGTVNLTGNNA